MVVHYQHASPERDRLIANALDNLAMDNSFADESRPIAPEDHKGRGTVRRNSPLAASLVGRPGLDPGTLGLKAAPTVFRLDAPCRRMSRSCRSKGVA